MNASQLTLVSVQNTFLTYSDYFGKIYVQIWDGQNWKFNSNPVATDCTTAPSSTSAGYNQLGAGVFLGGTEFADMAVTAYRTNNNDLKLIAFTSDGSQVKEPAIIDTGLLSGPTYPQNQPLGQVNVFYYKSDGLYIYSSDGQVGNPNSKTIIHKICQPNVDPSWFNFKPGVFYFNNEFYVLVPELIDQRYPIQQINVYKGSFDQWSGPKPTNLDPSFAYDDAVNFGEYAHMAFTGHNGHYISYSNQPETKWTNLILNNALGSTEITPFSGQLHFTHCDQTLTEIIDTFYINSEVSNWEISKMITQTLNGPNGKTNAPLVDSDGPNIASTALVTSSVNQHIVCFLDQKGNLQSIYYDVNTGKWNSQQINM